MIIVDTSIWIDHLRSSDEILTGLLQSGQVLAHPWVIGELALGNLARRETVLAFLRDLPRAVVATEDEVMRLIEQDKLSGRDIGYVDVHLLASTRLTPGSSLWTRDKRLLSAAETFGLVARVVQ